MRGYTLVELIMVIVMIGVLVGIGAPALLETVDAWSFSSRFQDFAVQSAIVTANRMSREIRRLKNQDSFSTAAASQLVFTDINNNSIDYNLSSNTIMRNSDGLCDNVTSLAFTYYDDSGNQLASVPLSAADRVKVRRITAAFSIQAGSNTLNFRFQTSPQNVRGLNELFQ